MDGAGYAAAMAAQAAKWRRKARKRRRQAIRAAAAGSPQAQRLHREALALDDMATAAQARVQQPNTGKVAMLTKAAVQAQVADAFAPLHRQVAAVAVQLAEIQRRTVGVQGVPVVLPRSERV